MRSQPKPRRPTRKAAWAQAALRADARAVAAYEPQAALFVGPEPQAALFVLFMNYLPS